MPPGSHRAARLRSLDVFRGATVAAMIAISLLAGYAIAMLILPVPGIGPANLNPETNLAAYVDRLFLSGHMWRLFTGGLAACTLGLLYWLIDAEGWSRGLGPALAFGRNAILVFVASGLAAKCLGLIHPSGKDGPALQALIYQTLCAPWASPMNASFAYAIANLILWYLLLRWLDRRGIRLTV